jgi:hypothetical protein
VFGSTERLSTLLEPGVLRFLQGFLKQPADVCVAE